MDFRWPRSLRAGIPRSMKRHPVQYTEAEVIAMLERICAEPAPGFKERLWQRILVLRDEIWGKE